MFLIVEVAKNWPTLFKIGETASVLNLLSYWANSFSQKSLITGSLTLSTTFSLKRLSVSILGISSIVEFGKSKRAKTVFLKICSSLGPQESPKIFLNIPTNPEATMPLKSSSTASRRLKAIGKDLSAGSNTITSLILLSGTHDKTFSANSP